MTKIKEIPGHCGYGADCDGNIYSSWHKEHLPIGRGFRYVRGPWQRLKTRFDDDGYLLVNLGSNARGRRVHRIILLAFIGPQPDGQQACHDNGNRADNRVTNLRWDTPKANSADSKRHGNNAVGLRNKAAKLSASDVLEVRRRIANQESINSIAKAFSIDRRTISGIRDGQAYYDVLHAEA